MSTANLVVSAFIGGVIGFAGSFSYFTPKIGSLEEQVALRPPVLVVDMAKLAVESVPVGSGKAAIEEHFRNTQAVISKFREAGFLILSRENIVSAPNDLMLDAEDIPANRHLSGGTNDSSN
ncbi:MAG: hypothetical protein AB2669_07910 [Candidatus Thiodiazotropha endolucinida]|nr:hypothetical protein [Candidatus Thiodiazotropha taylori]MCW4249647.1 hypothetical protein [Candidatus Thiodiazotropha endolucinida]MCG7883035.1 hypothetical protein [Candidatus Thiodiazotropha taylori]MCG8058677.1 hypothetical protein [Candidatus Thiodiazotropha taylori]MCG8104615.1 hypothetical protein [Candidatus Thiodiazotropha taylori]